MEELSQIELGENCFKSIRNVVLERSGAFLCVTVDLSSLSSISLNKNTLLGDETNKIANPKQVRYANQLWFKSC